MKKEYNKLIRDRIPEIIRDAGGECEVIVMEESEYLQSLRNKLVEEALEAQKAEPDDLPAELADIYEVMEAIMKAHQIDPAKVADLQIRRRNERGGFSKKLKLIWSDGNKDHKLSAGDEKSDNRNPDLP